MGLPKDFLPTEACSRVATCRQRSEVWLRLTGIWLQHPRILVQLALLASRLSVASTPTANLKISQNLTQAPRKSMNRVLSSILIPVRTETVPTRPSGGFRFEGFEFSGSGFQG